MDRFDADSAALTACQDELLPRVSRTFALTIPQLPEQLRIVVTNAYLLCRIADTIEDDESIGHVRKSELQSLFLSVVEGTSRANEFAALCLECLSDRTPLAERQLVERTSQVVVLTHRFSRVQRRAIRRCLETMCSGMSHFARCGGVHGLSTMADLDRYCYVVAGCVGEMLTELFCDYSPAIAGKRSPLMPLARSFGQGLQMTNILKDMREDRQHNACWLPRDLFESFGVDLSTLPASRGNRAFAEGISLLVGIARDHLRAALRYTQMIPKSESGVRNFCLWAIGLAVFTLRNIHNHPNFSSSREIKVTRRTVRGIIAISSTLAGSNLALSLAFSVSAHGLPRVALHQPWARMSEANAERDHVSGSVRQ